MIPVEAENLHLMIYEAGLQHQPVQSKRWGELQKSYAFFTHVGGIRYHY